MSVDGNGAAKGGVGDDDGGEQEAKKGGISVLARRPGVGRTCAAPAGDLRWSQSLASSCASPFVSGLLDVLGKPFSASSSISAAEILLVVVSHERARWAVGKAAWMLSRSAAKRLARATKPLFLLHRSSEYVRDSMAADFVRLEKFWEGTLCSLP